MPDNFSDVSVLTSGQSEDDLLTVNGQSWSLSLFQENLLGQMLVIKVRVSVSATSVCQSEMRGPPACHQGEGVCQCATCLSE
jgi:hypothetical protein